MDEDDEFGFDDIDSGISFSSIFSDLDFEEFQREQKSCEFLSNVDYSLNSPLIRDEIEEFLYYASGRPHRRAWSPKIWERRRRSLTEMKVNFRDITTPDRFHIWFANKNLSHKFNTTRIRGLVQKTQDDSDITFPVVKAYFKGWINKDVSNPNKTRCDLQIFKWGAMFLDFHILTLFLNARDEEEINQLLMLPGTKRVSETNSDSYVIRTDNFGRVLLAQGFAVFLDENVIMDRNTLLMCKDTYIGRFQTLFSMVNRVDEKYAPSDWSTMANIYRIGDTIMTQSGNSCYDGLKFLEPMCSLRMAELARRYRPLIPEFPDFREHIEGSIRACAEKGIYIRNLHEAVRELKHPDLALAAFSSFRHWGHPYLNYIEGLESLHDQVNMKKIIDDTYAQDLASDLAFIVLSKKFNETKRWYVDRKLITADHPLHSHITSHTWPTPKQIRDFGDNWHLLPLIPCFDIPDVIDPSLIYSDKSHSMNKSEVRNHIRLNPFKPIPTRKVLETFINKPATNWKEFLADVDANGLEDDDLIIGLKGKEREIKPKGRFYSLMSWRLREYFVVTEYLIKTFYVPLFKGLTMADDLNTVLKKLMDNSNGQGLINYENICIANHVDYTKWNNHQRHDANKHVFRVMGQFLGLPNLFLRTHLFFQKSLIYYTGRPDLMKVEGDQILNKGNIRVCWPGQLGGLEGLRQKGWSIVNLLVIRRESINCNTKIKILAQGDNQVICTQYKLQKHRNEQDLRESLKRVVSNNNTIMAAIEAGTNKLGLIINRDETLRSADYLVYGKVPIFRGNIKSLETKRWSRVTCVTNDQLPTLANTLSTINSNALTVAHFSTSPLNAIVQYNFLGNFGRNLIDLHNPALKGPTHLKVPKATHLESREYKVAVLYLDPCLGGVCGMSLTRFLIRGFPDPLTESLTFWKLIHDNGVPWLKNLAIQVGYPQMSAPSLMAFKKLLEDPLSLNLRAGVNPLTMIKEEIKASLIANSHVVKNQIVRMSLEYMGKEEDRLIEYLRSIKPLFPRFLSEYISGTFIGIIRSLIGLFQNSNTIRTVFSKRIDAKVKTLIILSEVQTICSLDKLAITRRASSIWKCSSSHADLLRLHSWGSVVFGATVPHPLEILGPCIRQGSGCQPCLEAPPEGYYISTLVPAGLHMYNEMRGPYKAYLGSRTSESTSILQPWEKETKVPLLRRAVKLRDSIGWFVDKDSNLARSLLQNLEALTGESWARQIEGFKRTGSALHRFSCSRQSSAGYAAQSPAKLTWMCSTTDTLSGLNTTNYDFMHQTLLLYAQATTSELMDNDINQGYFHSHIHCLTCLREIQEIELESDIDYHHKDVSSILLKWKPSTTSWGSVKKVKELIKGNWGLISPMVQSFHIGRAEGFLFGEGILSGQSLTDLTSLFPLSIQFKVIPRDYLRGILDGLIRASGIHCISRRAISELKRPREALLGVGLYLIDQISQSPGMLTLWRSKNFEALFFEIPHSIPASYPLSNVDLGMLGRAFLRSLYKSDYITRQFDHRNHLENTLWIFSDINESSLVALFSLSGTIVETLYSDNLNRVSKDQIRSFKDMVICYKDPNHTNDFELYRSHNIRLVDSELRHASKLILEIAQPLLRLNPIWGEELTVPVSVARVQYVAESMSHHFECKIAPRVQNPLISGMRLFQFATGSHYKLRSILKHFRIRFHDALVAGDGSGGIGAMLLRSNSQCRIIFNSLLKLDNVDLRGTTPSPPSAIYSLGIPRSRCINLTTSWEYPSDLSSHDTWHYFLSLKENFMLDLDLVIIDAELHLDSAVDCVEDKIFTYIFKLLPDHGSLIYKTYFNRLIGKTATDFLLMAGNLFEEVSLVYTDLTSSQSSEIYVVCRNKIQINLYLKPQLSELIPFFKKVPCFQTVQSEFQRAMNLRNKNFTVGIPHEFLSDATIELCQFVEFLGVETGVSALLLEFLSRMRVFDLSLYSDLLFLVSLNSLLNLTALYKTPPPPKKDTRVYNLGIFICGYLNWKSLCLRTHHCHATAQTFINKNFLFSWRTKKLEILKKDPESNTKCTVILYKMQYSFTGKYSNHKNFYLDSKLRLIGKYSRLMGRVFGYPEANDRHDQLIKLLKSFNEHLTPKQINSSTDIVELFDPNPKLNFSTPDSPSAANLNVHLPEVSYLS